MLQKKKNNIILKLLKDIKKYKCNFFFSKNLYLYGHLNKQLNLSLKKNSYGHLFNKVVTTSLYFWNFGLSTYIGNVTYLVNLNRKKRKKIFQKNFNLFNFRNLNKKKIKIFNKSYKKKNKLNKSLFYFFVKSNSNNLRFFNQNLTISSFFIFSYNKLFTDLFFVNSSYNNLLFFDYSFDDSQKLLDNLFLYTEKILNLFFVLRFLFHKKSFKESQLVFKKKDNINFLFIKYKTLSLLSLYSYNKIFFKFRNNNIFNGFIFSRVRFIQKIKNMNKILYIFFFNKFKLNLFENVFNNYIYFSGKNAIKFYCSKINILNYYYNNLKFTFFKSWLKKKNLLKKKKKIKKKKVIKFRNLKNIYYFNNNLKKTWFYYLKYYKRVTFIRKFKRLKFIYFNKINKKAKAKISLFNLYSFKIFSFNNLDKINFSLLYSNTFNFYKHITTFQLLINLFKYKKLFNRLSFQKIWSFFKLCKLNNTLNIDSSSNLKYILINFINQYSFSRLYKKNDYKKKKEFFTTFKLLQTLRLYQQDLVSYHGYFGVYFFKNIFSFFNKYNLTFLNKQKVFLKSKAVSLLLNKLQFNQFSNIFFNIKAADIILNNSNNAVNSIFKYKYFWLYLLQISLIDKNYFYNYSLFLYNKNYIISNFYYLWKWLSLFNMYSSKEISFIDVKSLKNQDTFLFNFKNDISFNNFSYLFNAQNISFNLFFIKRLRIYLKFFLKKNIDFYKKLYWLNLYYCKYSNYLNWRVKKKKTKKRNKKRKHILVKLRNIFVNCKHYNYYFKRKYKYNKNYNKFNKFKIFNILKKKENYLLNKLIVIIVNIQLNNTYVTATDLFGNVIIKACAGVLGIKGPKRSTPVATEEVTSFVCQYLKKNNYKFVILRLSGILYTRKMKAAIKALSPHKFIVIRALNITPKGHNGIRLKKRKRL